MTYERFQRQVQEYIKKAKLLAMNEHACGDYTVEFKETDDTYIAEVSYRGRLMFVIRHWIATSRFSVQKITGKTDTKAGSHVEYTKSRVFDFCVPPKRKRKAASAA